MFLASLFHARHLAVSEDDDLGGDFTAVDINGSCYSLVSCLAMDSLQTCAVYCGASADFGSLNNDGSVTSTDGDDITVQLPPATGENIQTTPNTAYGQVHL